MNLIVDFLSCLWEYAKERITQDIGAVADLGQCLHQRCVCFIYLIPFSDSADVLVTCPAAWDAKGCDMMREAAIAAGLVQSARAGDVNWRDRLRIITYEVLALSAFLQLTHSQRTRSCRRPLRPPYRPAQAQAKPEFHDL